MFIDVQWPEVGIEQQFIGLHIYRWLSPPLCAHVPLGIYQAPEAGPLKAEETKSDSNRAQLLLLLLKLSSVAAWPTAAAHWIALNVGGSNNLSAMDSG